MSNLYPHADTYLREAFSLALQARARGNHPFGALLVLGEQIVLRAENTVITERDETRHAELNLCSLANRALSREDRRLAVLYTSTEPCAMCAGAIYWSGIRHVVFGCSAAALGTLAGKSLKTGSHEVFRGAREPVSVVGPLLEAEAVLPHANFWQL